MDIDMLSKGIGLFSSTIIALKQAIELIPNSPKKEEAKLAVEQAERELRIAEASVATKLGYQICKKHFPPIMEMSRMQKYKG